MSTQPNSDSSLPSKPAPETPMPTIDDIKAVIAARHDAAADRLTKLRAQRDRINAQIREATAERDEAARLFRALKPRASKKKPTPK